MKLNLKYKFIIFKYIFTFIEINKALLNLKIFLNDKSNLFVISLN